MLYIAETCRNESVDSRRRLLVVEKRPKKRNIFVQLQPFLFFWQHFDNLQIILQLSCRLVISM